MTWFTERWPEHKNSLRVSMNGITFNNRKWGSIMWNKMRSLGVQKSEADIAIMIPKGGYGGFLSEHKAAGQPHKLSEEQQAYLDYHNSIGNCAVSTRGLEALKAATIAYMGE